MSKSGILNKKLVTGAIAGLLLAVTACSSQGGAQNAPAASGGGDSGGPSFTIAMVTHEAPAPRSGTGSGPAPSRPPSSTASS